MSQITSDIDVSEDQVSYPSVIIVRLGKLATSVSRWVSWIAGAGVVAMLALTIADIIGIKLFKSPVPGAIEIVGFLGIVVTTFAIAYTYILRGHIRVEFFVTQLPLRWRAGINALVSLVGIVLFVLLAWQSYVYGHILQTTGEVSMTQRIPFYPFVYAIAFSCIPVCLVLLLEFLQSALRIVQK